MKRYVYGVVKSERSGGLMGDRIVIDVANDLEYSQWLSFSGGYAANRGYDFMTAPSFWDFMSGRRRSFFSEKPVPFIIGFKPGQPLSGIAVLI